MTRCPPCACADGHPRWCPNSPDDLRDHLARLVESAKLPPWFTAEDWCEMRRRDNFERIANELLTSSDVEPVGGVGQ